MPLNALGRHLALIGFMGAGKSTLAPVVAERLARRAIDVDDELGVDIPALFARGEDAFRAVEEPRTCELLATPEPAVLALGGGSIKSSAVRAALAARAFTVLVDVHVDEAWERVKATDRPLAQDEETFRRLNDERRPLYGGIADATAADADGVLLAAAGVHHEADALDALGELVPGDGPVALVSDERVLELYGARARAALGDRLASTHPVPPGERAKQLDVLARLWLELGLDRNGTVVALGGGTTTDVAGFAAATYLRGVPWVSVPTTLVGQVDAGIGGKTGVDTQNGKNLAGAFHWPARVVVDDALLETLPERERRNGETERLKTELLAGRPIDARAAAAYKCALCLRDPYDRGPRRWLNLGHTFGHALEAAAAFELPHGEAVALGLLAALRLSGRDTAPVESALDPRPVRVDRERAWEALLRDKKRSGGEINLVLLGDDGPTVEARPADEVRAALDSLIDG
ncbi:MAG TPA: bifunctional shikimate kinase/3-dehydroquinate synthase [Gaiellaceae bacterium]|jgi:shikimate kinase/3-dehydroquinate synthase